MIYTLTLNPAVDRELVVPAITFDSVLRALEWRVDPGGKGFNVSRMLMALGTPSVALGFVAGQSGKLLENGLQSLGISTDFNWVDGETRTNVSIVTAARDHYVKVNEPGPTILADDRRRILEKIRGLAGPGDWWVLSGSLPPGIPADFYAEIVTLVQSASAAAILDVSGEALLPGCMAGPHLLKPNEVELHGLTHMPVDTDADLARAATAVQRMGVVNVAVSLGKRGAMLLDEQSRAWLSTSPPITESNPIGAGDSLVGGLVWGLQQGLSMIESMRWGIACGAATAACSGTAVGERNQVEALQKQVDVRLLDPID